MSTTKDNGDAGNRRVAAYLPEATITELDRIAQEEHRTRSATIATAIDSYIMEHRRASARARSPLTALANLGRVQ